MMMPGGGDNKIQNLFSTQEIYSEEKTSFGLVGKFW